jgi:cell division protein FtsB
MLEFQEKRRYQKFIYSKVTLIILIIVIFFLLNAVWNVYKKQAMTKDNLIKTATVYESLQAREKMLSSEIERLKTDSGAEEEIRERYGLIRPGEEVIIIVDEHKDKNSPANSSSATVWQKIWNWLQ